MSIDAPVSISQPEIFPIANEKKKKVPFFALVIGIDDYEMVSKLSGAVADADDMDRFLRGHLDVPKDHIINLRDRRASRKGIIQAFRDLQKNEAIDRDDAIFIYFAGHGSEMEAPTGWPTSGSTIQVLLPQDVNTLDSSHKPIPPLPDRTVATLLDDLARDKGNNITVVFDCCHSSSGTRDDENVPERVARVVKLTDNLPKDLDKGLFPDEKGRSMNTPTEFLQRNLRSHILLAACGSEELAYENTRLGRGAFTTAFVETLKITGVDKLTYMGLMERLPSLPKQNPQCEGYHRDRMLFNAIIPGANRVFIAIEQNGDTYKLKAGTAQGITADSEFDIHADHILDPETNPSLCRMRATVVDPFRSTLEFLASSTSVSLPKPAYAREVLCGSGQELRVHFTDAFRNVVSVDDVRLEAISANEPDFGFLDEELDAAEIVVDVKDMDDGKRAVFWTTNAIAREHGFEKMPHDVLAKAKFVSKVLRAAARWNYHFKRNNPARFSGSVRVEFHRLENVDDNFDEDGLQILLPAGNDLNRTGLVDLVVNPDEYFGAKIVNESKLDLYPYLFYFDISDQCIEPYYLASTGKQQVDPPLRAGSSLTVGYGAGGEVPFAFHLRKSEDVDVGFLKLFLTTSPTDFDSLKQSSPFEMARAPLSKTDIIRKLKESEQNAEHWGTVMTAIVQRSSPRPVETPSKPPAVSPPNPLKPANGWLTGAIWRISDFLVLGCCS